MYTNNLCACFRFVLCVTIKKKIMKKEEKYWPQQMNLKCHFDGVSTFVLRNYVFLY